MRRSPPWCSAAGRDVEPGADLSRTLPTGVFVGALPAGPRSSRSVVGALAVGAPGERRDLGGHRRGPASPVADVLRTPLTLTGSSRRPRPRIEPAGAPSPDVVLSRRLGEARQSRCGGAVARPRGGVLPWDDSFAFRGLFRLGTPMPETALDDMEGAPADVRATSSSQAFGLPTGRASMALDGDEGTGWLPAEPAVGERWRAPARTRLGPTEITLSSRTGATADHRGRGARRRGQPSGASPARAAHDSRRPPVPPSPTSPSPWRGCLRPRPTGPPAPRCRSATGSRDPAASTQAA